MAAPMTSRGQLIQLRHAVRTVTRKVRAGQCESDVLARGVYRLLGCWEGECRVKVESPSLGFEYGVYHDDLQGGPSSVRWAGIDLSGCDGIDAKAKRFEDDLLTHFAHIHPSQHVRSA